jgi:hypothetical protein
LINLLFGDKKMMTQKVTIPTINGQRTDATGLDYDSSLPCWEIIGCDTSKKCQAKERPDIPCWEVAYYADDYRRHFNVCQDCIVHVLKTNGLAILS